MVEILPPPIQNPRGARAHGFSVFPQESFVGIRLHLPVFRFQFHHIVEQY